MLKKRGKSVSTCNYKKIKAFFNSLYNFMADLKRLS